MCAQVIFSTAVEVLIGVLIAFSFILVVIEADHIGNPNPPAWIKIANVSLLFVYAIEVAVRIYVLRGKFFCSAMNIMDLTIVVADAVAESLEAADFDTMPSLVVLRIFRLLRLARSLKVMVKFPQLALMVKGVVNALSAVMYGVSFLFMIIVFWSVCAVHFINPVNQRVRLAGKYGDCDRCGRAFESVSQSMLTFVQQIVCGDSWGLVTVPIIEEAPETALFFALVFVSIALTITNVILAVIVDTAFQTRQDDVQEILKQKVDDFQEAAKHLKKVCKHMDTDNSGDLTIAELKEGFVTNKEFHDLLMSMDVTEDDLEMVFSILDADGSGTLNYEEFITELFKMKTHDSHTMLVFVKHFVTDIRRDVREQLHLFKDEVLAKLAKLDDTSGGKVREHDSLGSGKTLTLEAHAPLEAPLEKKEQKKREPEFGDLPVHEGSTRHLWEELRDLRAAVNEQLLCSVREISEKSESHERLLATIAGDTSLLRGSNGPTVGNTFLSSPEGGAGGHGALARHRPPSSQPSIAACGPVLRYAEQQDGFGIIPRSQSPSPIQPAHSSAWGMRCCGPQRTQADDPLLSAMSQKTGGADAVNAV